MRTLTPLAEILAKSDCFVDPPWYKELTESQELLLWGKAIIIPLVLILVVYVIVCDYVRKH